MTLDLRDGASYSSFLNDQEGLSYEQAFECLCGVAVWLKDGRFLIKKAYTMIRGQVPNVPSKNLICSNVASPKALFIYRIALHGRLRTEDLIMKWRIAYDPLCSLCSVYPENHGSLAY